uniref:SEC22 homolog A, vesicle trafficking protein n=1 Tax=Neolamprologus brichardi TaxID=32507 RepID=A0A3Q4GDG1_NEOBR
MSALSSSTIDRGRKMCLLFRKPVTNETTFHQSSGFSLLSEIPSKCYSFTSSLGVGYLMVCTASYPNVLAFCFLDELQKEFIVTYDTKRIKSSAMRPYSFIEFDTFIQKTKQRYNNPRSLSTKINLADMQTEIKLRPPYQLSPEDLRAINGFSVHAPSKYKGIAPTQMLEPVTLPGIVSCVLSILCGGLNLLRGVHAIESILQNDDEDFNYVIAFFLGTAACLYQCYLFAYFSVWRNSKSFLAFALICLSNMYLYELRNIWQILFHVAVGAFMTLQIRLRQPLGKAPDYNV